MALVKILVGVATVENRAAFGAIEAWEHEEPSAFSVMSALRTSKGLILGNLMYSQLRTEEQLGYVVQGAVGSMSNAPRLQCWAGRCARLESAEAVGSILAA